MRVQWCEIIVISNLALLIMNDRTPKSTEYNPPKQLPVDLGVKVTLYSQILSRISTKN